MMLNITRKGTVYLGYCLLVIVASFATSAHASKTINERVDQERGAHQETVEDMTVKVLGGYISVQRTYRVMEKVQGDTSNLGVSGAIGDYAGNSLVASSAYANASLTPVWQFHRKWHDLIQLDANYQRTDNPDTIQYIDRNDSIYERVKGEDYFEYEYNGSDLRITLNDTGMRWTNRNGDWIDYDAQGRALASGDKNDVGITLTRNTDGLIHQYKDHFDRVMLTWEYNGNYPTSVTDYSGRKVTYSWEDNELVKVTDVRSNDWNYEYTSFGNHRALTKKTDPEEQEFQYSYAMSGGGFVTTNSSLISGSSQIDCDLVIGDLPIGTNCNNSSASNTASNVSSQTIQVQSMLMHTAKIYPDGKRITYQYYYDFNAEAYMILTSNSDGYEVETWYDLDGQVRYKLEGGKITATRIRSNRVAVQVDPYGNQTTTDYDRWENIEKIIYDDGSTEQYEYLANYNFPTLMTDEIGVKTKHDYDANGNRIRTTSAFGTDEARIVEYEYDEYGQVEIERYVGDEETSTIQIGYEYDSVGNLIKVTSARGYVTEFKDFNAIGLYRIMIDAREMTWQYTYDLDGTNTSAVTPLEFITNYEYDKLGRIIEYIDAEAHVTKYAYDSRNNLITSTNNLGDVAATNYRMDGQITSSIDESGKVKAYRYDRAARLIEMTDGVGNQTTYEYELGNELNGQRIQTRTTSNMKEFFQYDSRNRVTQTRSISIKDDEVVSVISKEYNHIGQTVKEIDPNGEISEFTYSNHGEVLTKTTNSDESILFSYDVRGNQKRITDAMGKITNYSYDHDNSLVLEIRPMGEIQTYEYDESNNKIKHTDYNGNVAVFTIDDDGRTIGENNTKYGETMPERVVTYSFDKTNLPTGYQDNFSSESYEYDELGRIEEQTSTFFTNGESMVKILKTSYYKNGQIKSRFDAENNLTSFTYDAADKLTQINIQNSGSVLFNSYEGELVTQITYPGGTKRNLEYDGLARLKRIKVEDSAGNTKMDYQYAFDGVGNITNKTTRLGEYIYQYDNDHRITSVEQPNNFGDQSYTYDNNSNRLTLTNQEGLASYTYNDNHELTNIVLVSDTQTTNQEFQYDNNGAQTAQLNGQGETLSMNHYNSFGRLDSVEKAGETIAEYQYNPYGERISKLVNGETTYFLYDQVEGGLVGEYDQAGVLIRGYSYKAINSFSNEPVSQKVRLTDTNGELLGYQYSFYQNDFLGTPQQLLEISGATIWQIEYDVFGETDVILSGRESLLRLPGQYQDEETDYYYNWNRYYDSTIGRYIASDPIGLNGGLNTYEYVGSNPVNRVDPTGLFIAAPNGSGRPNAAGGGDGAGVLCRNRTPTPVLFGDWSHCLEDCAIAHENSHIDDINNSNPNICQRPDRDGWRVYASSDRESKQTELKGYGVEKRCLRTKRDECDPDDECYSIIINRIKNIEATMARLRSS